MNVRDVMQYAKLYRDFIHNSVTQTAAAGGLRRPLNE